MPELLIKHMKADGALRDKAKPIAEELLGKFRIAALQEHGWKALEGFRDALEGGLKALALEAFRQGKQAAYEVIAAIPPQTKVHRAERGMNDIERTGWIERHLEAWRLEYEGESKALINRLGGHAASMKAAGLNGKAIDKAIKRDWDSRSNTGRPNGRITSAWINFVPVHAEALIGKAEMWGQECGYYGVGK